MSTADDGVYCPQCGTFSEADARYCYRCGTELPLVNAKVQGLSQTALLESSTANSGDKEQSQPSFFASGMPTDRVIAPVPESIPQQRKYPPKEGFVPLTEADTRYLDGYSFGPGCGYYLLNRALWWRSLVVLGPIRLAEGILAGIADAGDISRGLAITLFVLYLLCEIGVFTFIAWLGKFARWERWQKLKWKSFAQYQREENQWNIAGAIMWLFAIGYVIYSIGVGLSPSR
jgi:hypothetical protein